jgi:hypothetical protein
VILLDPSTSISEEEPDFRIIPNFPEFTIVTTSEEDDVIENYTTEKPRGVDDYGTCPNTDRYVILGATTQSPEINVNVEITKKVSKVHTTTNPIDYDSSDFGTCLETTSVAEDTTANPLRAKKNLEEQTGETVDFLASNEALDAIIIENSDETEFLIIPTIVQLGDDEISHTQSVILEEKKRILDERNSDEDMMNLIDTDHIPSISNKESIDEYEGLGVVQESKSTYSRFLSALFSGFGFF